MTIPLFNPRTGTTYQADSDMSHELRTVLTRIPRTRPAPSGPTIDERFAAFHAAHPDVYQTLVALCREARSRGRRRIAIGTLWEVLRWNRILAGLPDPGEDRKLNDHYRSRFARLIMESEPDLRSIFETRALRSP